MNKKAIVVYVDKTTRCLEEFTWLYKTWLLWDLNDEYDIVAFCNPEIESSLPKNKSLITKSLEPLNKKGDIWHSYGFVNSFAMFNDKHNIDLVSKYDYLLKSDCDVFLTKNLKGLNPSKVMIGQGGYMEYGDVDLIISKLKKYSNKLDMRYNNMNHIGASIFARTDEVVKVVRYHFQLTKFILQSGWDDNDIGTWPGWYKGVASMYAIHLVINHMYGPQTCNLYSIDSRCWNMKIEKDVYHIHAWHTQEYWSKKKHFNGEYDVLESNKIPETSEQYCHWIASNNLDKILSCK